jgi:carbonic anhydrase
MDLNRVLENNQKWVQSKLAESGDYFQDMTKGQNPEVLYIGCSDSRVTAEELMGAKAGEVFVHRNIANMVINIDLNVQSVLEYAVAHLQVKHIVVCGHYVCGGVKSAMEAKDLGLLNPWLRNIRDVYRMHKEELNAISDETKRYDRLVELNVEEQTFNLLKVASVQKAIKNRGLKVHGWVFNMHNGELIDMKIDMEAKLREIMEIYDLGK